MGGVRLEGRVQMGLVLSGRPLLFDPVEGVVRVEGFWLCPEGTGSQEYTQFQRYLPSMLWF